MWRHSALVLAGPSICRIDKSTLPQQSPLALLIENIDKEEKVYVPANEILAFAEWNGSPFRAANEGLDLEWGAAHVDSM